MIALTFRGSTLLLSLLLAGYGCGSDSGSGPGLTTGELGPPSNTGIPGASLASVIPFSAKRPENIDMDYLTDANGLSLRANTENDLNSRQFNALGDVNGDGVADFMYSTSAQTFVVFGNGQRLQSDASGGSLSGTDGFTLTGSYRFAGIGDINGDGVGDLAWLTYEDSRMASGVRVVFGRRDGQLQQAIEAPFAGVDGFDIVNNLRLEDIRTFQSAGDFNADGVDDLLIGAFAFNGNDYAAPNAWVVYGSSSSFEPSIDVAALNSDQGLTLVSPLSAEQLAAVYDDIGTGYNASVAGGFDINGDGVSDIAIGASRFDWLAQSAEARTYVVYGSSARSAGVLDLTALDGVDGLRISAAQPSMPAPDRISAVGDFDADGHDDLALVGDDGSAFVFYADQSTTGPQVDRENLLVGLASRLSDSSGGNIIAHVSAVGDLDGDAVDELAIEFNSGQAAIIYGTADQRLPSVDLSAAGDIDVTWLRGGGDALSIGDASSLVALGDIDSDSIDDLGWGWTARSFNDGIAEIADINHDGVNDLQIGAPDGASVSLLRVLYGFGQSGFTGVLASTQGPAPIASVEQGFYDQLLAAMDDGARTSLDQINSSLSSGANPGATATACLAGSNGVDTATVQQFNCVDAPLALSFDWGSGKYSGSGEALFEAVDRQDDRLHELRYSSYPAPTQAPGGNPFLAFVTYDADATLLLETGYQNTDGCSIDSQTHQTLASPDICSSLVFGAIQGLAGVFGADSTVQNLQLRP